MSQENHLKAKLKRITAAAAIRRYGPALISSLVFSSVRLAAQPEEQALQSCSSVIIDLRSSCQDYTKKILLAEESALNPKGKCIKVGRKKIQQRF